MGCGSTYCTSNAIHDYMRDISLEREDYRLRLLQRQQQELQYRQQLYQHQHDINAHDHVPQQMYPGQVITADMYNQIQQYTHGTWDEKPFVKKDQRYIDELRHKIDKVWLKDAITINT